MKVAFATTDGLNVDEHFGRAGMFAVYDVDAEGSSFVEKRVFSEDGRDKAVEASRQNPAEHESLMEAKVERLKDCRLIFMQEIGGPSAARLTRYGIMPMKVKDEASIQGNLDKLAKTLKDNPPLWLKKAAGQNGK